MNTLAQCKCGDLAQLRTNTINDDILYRVECPNCHEETTYQYHDPNNAIREWNELHGDIIQKPAHYNSGKYETIEVIKDITGELYEGYLLGNVLKYVSRYQHKNGVEDLKKARVYLDWLIGEVKE